MGNEPVIRTRRWGPLISRDGRRHLVRRAVPSMIAGATQGLVQLRFGEFSFWRSPSKAGRELIAPPHCPLLRWRQPLSIALLGLDDSTDKGQAGSLVDEGEKLGLRDREIFHPNHIKAGLLLEFAGVVNSLAKTTPD